jgi:arginyl-tRNA synthetase
VITAELRQAIVAAAGLDADPRLRPGPAPGSYASSLPFRLPSEAAQDLARRLAAESWIAHADITAPGYLTVTVTHDALATLAVRIVRAGPACAASDALRGRPVPAPPPPDLPAEPSWPAARAALAAHLTARLAATAGASVAFYPERAGVPLPGTPAPSLAERSPAGPAAVLPPAPPPRTAAPSGPVAEAIRYAGADQVRFALARMPPGGPAPEAAAIARHVLANPAYAVRYAHAAAVAVLRWAAALGSTPAGFRSRQLAEPGELALLDALAWLPEWVAVAARRGRPDEFAGYLEELAGRTLDTMDTTGFTAISTISSERLWLADAARTGLATGLGLLGVSAPGRL